MQVKGKKEPIHVYEPLCVSDEADETLLRHVEQYRLARENYLARRWQEAHSQLSELAADAPRFRKLCDVYLERIHQYRLEPPPEDWRGIWQHTSK
jgi:adenylate cyclase